MLLPAGPIRFRNRPQRKKKKSSAPPAPPALMLVAASYDPGDILLTLTFDRAIDIASINAAVILVNDDSYAGLLLAGDSAGAVLLDPATVQMPLIDAGASTPGPITMSAGATNGIVAVDDGGTWGGASDLTLPWP
jgi:hypothetical protein